MQKLIVFSFLLLSFANAAFAQSRPKIDGSVQKANKRPPPPPAPQPQTTENKPESEARKPAATAAGETDAAVLPPDSAGSGAVEADGEVLRIDTNLVTIPVRVSDRSGNFVAGLTKENFKVFEDGIDQEIAYFSSA